MLVVYWGYTILFVPVIIKIAVGGRLGLSNSSTELKVFRRILIIMLFVVPPTWIYSLIKGFSEINSSLLLTDIQRLIFWVNVFIGLSSGVVSLIRFKVTRIASYGLVSALSSAVVLSSIMNPLPDYLFVNRLMAIVMSFVFDVGLVLSIL
jgi:hypothetical protein